MKVPFFRPDLSDEEVVAVEGCLRSGWLTTGPEVKRFEAAVADYLGVKHAVALNSCTAALHLALDAIGLRRGDFVLVPTMTFAATAEVVRYFDATPVLVDCDATTLCIDPAELRRTLEALRDGRPAAGLEPPYGPLRAVIPMHYGGQMVDVDAVRSIADDFSLAVIEDAAHTLPARYRAGGHAPWRTVGTTGDISCFSFYANKCITTGEGGMAVTDDEGYAERMRIMSLHGLSSDAWQRYSSGKAAPYRIVAPGFKYNMTDIAAALGVRQLARADELLRGRRRVAERYQRALSDVPWIVLPVELPDRQHAWHLYAIRIDPDALGIDRDELVAALADRGITTSMHWYPLHLHPYYQETYGLREGLFPVAEDAARRLVSLPIFPSMTDAEVDYVVATLRSIAAEHAA